MCDTATPCSPPSPTLGWVPFSERAARSDSRVVASSASRAASASVATLSAAAVSANASDVEAAAPSCFVRDASSSRSTFRRFVCSARSSSRKASMSSPFSPRFPESSRARVQARNLTLQAVRLAFLRVPGFGEELVVILAMLLFFARALLSFSSRRALRAERCTTSYEGGARGSSRDRRARRAARRGRPRRRPRLHPETRRTAVPGDVPGTAVPRDRAGRVPARARGFGRRAAHRDASRGTGGAGVGTRGGRPGPAGSLVRDARRGMGAVVPRRGPARRPSRARPRGPAPVGRRGRRRDTRRGRTRGAGAPEVSVSGVAEPRGLVAGIARGGVLGMSRKPGTDPGAGVRASGVPPGVSRGRAGHCASFPTSSRSALGGARRATARAADVPRREAAKFPFSFFPPRFLQTADALIGSQKTPFFPSRRRSRL